MLGFEKLGKVKEYIGPILYLIAAIIAFPLYVDSRIKDKIREEEYIKEIAYKLRPYVIFDEKGTILYNEGGKKYIKDIQVSPGKDGKEPEKIVVFPYEPLNRTPILHCLNDRFQITHSLAPPYNHVFELGSPVYLQLEVEFKPSVDITSWLFKLEVLH